MDKAEFMRLYAQGLNDRQIAEAMHYCDRNIQRIRTKLGLPVNPPGEKERMELYTQGLNDTQIARQLGMTQNTITVWRNRRGLPGNHPRCRKRREDHAKAQV